MRIKEHPIQSTTGAMTESRLRETSPVKRLSEGCGALSPQIRVKKLNRVVIVRSGIEMNGGP